MSKGPEIIDILNEKGEVVGQMDREQAERDNHTTPNVLIWLFNSDGKFWQKK